ncbi:hypothetical protein GCM10008090_30990 [Arenicella chitinivorans]|uniref:HprK-related kinase A n=1 Tax=Arenicella chitinivorans TaxID=1329800 RepID=A0A918S093_9GAMM|nr:hypothetical protein [Arenicella chitinivorans]GHA19043.1 hypothetical protein GCM10008090_30990 [Arenicella chitinivorans]
MRRWLIEYGGVELTVCAKGDAAEGLVELALAAIPAEPVARSHGTKIVVGFDSESSNWTLLDHTAHVERKLSASGDLIYHLTDRIVFHVADRAKNVHCLHAAAVAHNGHALIVPASSGAGKSSFTTWLAANGYDYVTDELILIDAENKLQGIARPIQIKAHGLEAIDHLIEQSDLVQQGRFANAVPPASLGARFDVSGELSVSMFVFIKFQKGADFEFERLSSGDAGMRLMANHVNARSLEGHGFRAMMKLIRETPCYVLNYGGFDTLPEGFAGELKALLAS